MKKIVLFVDEDNSCKSQMAEAIFNAMSKRYDLRYNFEAMGAGISPKSHLNPEAVRVMVEVGVDMRSPPKKYFPKSLESKLIMDNSSNISNIICLYDGEKNNIELSDELIKIQPEYWNFSSSEGQSLKNVRKTRDLLREKVLDLLEGLKEGHW